MGRGRHLKRCDKCRRIARFFTTSYQYDDNGDIIETTHESLCKLHLYQGIRTNHHNRVDNYQHKFITNGPGFKTQTQTQTQTQY